MSGEKKFICCSDCGKKIFLDKGEKIVEVSCFNLNVNDGVDFDIEYVCVDCGEKRDVV